MEKLDNKSGLIKKQVLNSIKQPIIISLFVVVVLDSQKSFFPVLLKKNIFIKRI